MSAASQPGLCLIAEAREGEAWLARLAAALDASGAVTLILVPAQGATFDAASTRSLVAMAQAKNVAALLADDIPAARAAAADGVHLSWRPEIEDAYEAARNALGPDAIVGADPGLSRHDAMQLGEAGADYISFSPAADAATEETEDALAVRVAWWAEIFVVPVVAFGIEATSEVSEMVAAGADFIAVHLPPEKSAEADAAWADELRRALAHPARAA